MSDCDVLIAGAGPAGCAAAIPLAKAGLRVRMIEHHNKPRFSVGETLPPRAVDQAEALLGPALEDCAYRTRGTVSVWGDEAAVIQDFFFTPKQYGLCVDRGGFDAALRARAIAAGAELSQGARITEIRQLPDQSWYVEREHQGARRHGTCRVLIDATGRCAVLARLLGMERQADDTLFAYAQRFRTDAITADQDRLPRIEALPFGWCYSTVLPGQPDTRIVVLHTDRDQPEAWLARDPEGFLSLLKQSTLIRPLLEAHAYRPEGRICGAQAGQSRQTDVAPAGFFTVGDAAQCYDPLSSQGITEAIASGTYAATVIAKALSRKPGKVDLDKAQSKYAARQAQAWHSYADSYTRIYAQEWRWPAAPFWLRRQGQATPPIPPQSRTACL
ncbi:FAD-dependent monooxygenase [Primorskyibacter sp. 2E107]|uniref:FAD-dependent monooxygenase n=1 Tax=Primorskyibacter sp. 2E107 TaxID=3403458 RepID=UPI003AF6A4EF